MGKNLLLVLCLFLFKVAFSQLDSVGTFKVCKCTAFLEDQFKKDLTSRTDTVFTTPLTQIIKPGINYSLSCDEYEIESYQILISCDGGAQYFSYTKKFGLGYHDPYNSNSARVLTMIIGESDIRKIKVMNISIMEPNGILLHLPDLTIKINRYK